MFEGVVPAVFIQRAVFNRAYGILPLVTGFKTVPLDDTTTGETEYARVKVIKGLCVVFTLLWARIAAVFANKATPKTLNRATGVVLVVLGVVIMGFNLLT